MSTRCVASHSAYGCAAASSALQLLVADDAPGGGVDEQHLAGPQPILQHDLVGGQVEHAGFRGQDHAVVGGDAVARRPQAVAIEHRADLHAVGEGDRRRAVPRLHQRRVVLVERPHRRVHRRVAGPRLGDHHQHGVRQRAPGHHQELEHVVERRGVAAAGRDHRQHLGEVVAEQARLEQALAGAHPVDVALQRVDLAVVGDVAIGVGQRPRRERVGREALVHQGQRRVQLGVGEVGVHRPQLRGGQHALVGQRPRRQADDVEPAPGRLRHCRILRGLLDPLADDVERTLEARGRVGAVHRR